MRIRLRLVLLGAVVAGLALLVFGLLFDRLVAIGVPEDQDRQLSDLARRGVAAVLDADAAELRPSSSADPDLLAGHVASGTDPFLAVLVGDDGGSIVLSGPADIEPIAEALPDALVEEIERSGGAEATISVDDHEYRLQLRRWVRPDTGQSGIVVAGQSTEFAAQQVAGSRVFLVVSGLVALIAAVVAGYVISGRALRPLRDLAATTDEIGRTGDLSRRLPEAGSHDEVGHLTDSFNAMLTRLQEAQDRLARTVEAQRRFIADASHELRTPLTTIRSNAAFLAQHPQARAEDRDDAVADIAAESERMSRLVDGLLSLARADAEPVAAGGPVDLADTVEGVVQRFRRLGTAVTLHADRPALVAGDGDGLTQVAAILVDNATVHGGGEVRVDLWTSDRTVTLAVSDHGRGLDRHDLERVFERFYRADGATLDNGAGLGLAIARAIVEAHGGSIRAANRDGGGAVFVVDLPLPNVGWSSRPQAR